MLYELTEPETWNEEEEAPDVGERKDSIVELLTRCTHAPTLAAAH